MIGLYRDKEDFLFLSLEPGFLTGVRRETAEMRRAYSALKQNPCEKSV